MVVSPDFEEFLWGAVGDRSTIQAVEPYGEIIQAVEAEGLVTIDGDPGIELEVQAGSVVDDSWRYTQIELYRFESNAERAVGTYEADPAGLDVERDGRVVTIEITLDEYVF